MLVLYMNFILFQLFINCATLWQEKIIYARKDLQWKILLRNKNKNIFFEKKTNTHALFLPLPWVFREVVLPNCLTVCWLELDFNDNRLLLVLRFNLEETNLFWKLLPRPRIRLRLLQEDLMEFLWSEPVCGNGCCCFR